MFCSAGRKCCCWRLARHCSSPWRAVARTADSLELCQTLTANLTQLRLRVSSCPLAEARLDPEFRKHFHCWSAEGACWARRSGNSGSTPLSHCLETAKRHFMNFYRTCSVTFPLRSSFKYTVALHHSELFGYLLSFRWILHRHLFRPSCTSAAADRQ